jgi:hypothetical protein
VTKSLLARYGYRTIFCSVALSQAGLIASFNLIYSSDGSFRFFNDLISNQNQDFALNPLNYFTNRIWVDNYRQILLSIAELFAWDFASIKYINSFTQVAGLFGLYFALFLVVKKSLNPILNSLTFLPILILFPVLSVYLDAHIIWAYPIYSIHFLIYINEFQPKWSKVLFAITTLLLTGIHEYTVPYFFLMIFVGMILLRSKRMVFSVFMLRILFTSIAFFVSLLNYLLHKGEYSTLGQLRFLGVINLNNFQYSSYTFAFAIFLTAFLFLYFSGVKSFVYILEIAGLVVLTLAYFETSNFIHSNFWVGYLLRNDFVLFFTCILFVVVIAGKFAKPLDFPRKHFFLLVAVIQLLGILMTLNYGSSYKKCWDETQDYVSKNGFSTVDEVSQFGECQVNWVAPMTSLVMGDSEEPDYLLINKSTASNDSQTPEGGLALNERGDGIFLPYKQFIGDGFWGLDLRLLISNLKTFGVSKLP